jgi:uncharacterized protein YjbI with pentapeptide repeats
LKNARFRSAIFATSSYFIRGTVFAGHTDFQDALWMKDADFDHASFLSEADFSWAIFEGPAYFSNIVAEEKPAKEHIQESLEEEQEDDEDEGSTGHVIFEGARFNARAYFNGSHLAEVDFSKPAHLSPVHEEPWGKTFDSVVFADRAIFRDAALDMANFSKVEFHAYADFLGTHFGRRASFDGTTFETEADFRDAQFSREVSFDEARFQKTAGLEWSQLEHALKSNHSTTYASLEENFDRLGDLGSKNQFHYLKEFYRLQQLRGWGAWKSQASRFFWGYGVRPWYVLLWMTAGYILFSVLHLRHFWKVIGHLSISAGRRLITPLPLNSRQAQAEYQAAAEWKLAGSELRHVLAASGRATLSLSPKDPHLGGPLYVVQFLIMKSLLLLFVYSLANISPVLQVLTRGLHM